MKHNKFELVAEVAQGFEGKVSQALLYVKAAYKSGADSVKFQMIYAEEIATLDYKHYQLFKSLEMKDQEWVELSEFAIKLGIELQLDIFGNRSLSLANKLGVRTIKLHPTDISNISFLSEIASNIHIARVILGAGGAQLDEIFNAINILKNKKIILMLGFQSYPTLNEDNQISRVKFLSDYFKNNDKVDLGFADHSVDQNMSYGCLSAVAVGAGALMIEKHITLAKVLELEDHESALNPDEFLIYSNTLKMCANAYGNEASLENYKLMESELEYRKNTRRDVVMKHDLPQGSTISPGDVILKRSANPRAIKDLKEVCGKRAKIHLKKDFPVTLDCIHG